MPQPKPITIPGPIQDPTKPLPPGMTADEPEPVDRDTRHSQQRALLKEAMVLAIAGGAVPTPGDFARIFIEAMQELARKVGIEVTPEMAAEAEQAVDNVNAAMRTGAPIPSPTELENAIDRKLLAEANAFRERVRLWARTMGETYSGAPIVTDARIEDDTETLSLLGHLAARLGQEGTRRRTNELLAKLVEAQPLAILQSIEHALVRIAENIESLRR